MKYRWLNITRNQSNDPTINLYGIIGDEDTDDRAVVSQINEIDQEGGRINVRINSPGGFINVGYGIFNALLNAQADVHTYIDGEASSMGSVIAMVGKTVNMSKYATMMIHRPAGMVSGRSEAMRNYADQLDKLENQLIDIYTQRTGKSQEDIRNLMAEEKHLNAEEANHMGFVDEIFNKKIKKASNMSRTELMNLIYTKDQTNCQTQNANMQLHQMLATALSQDPQHVEAATLVNKVQDLIKEKQGLEEKVNNLEKEKKEQEEQQIEQLLEGAVNDGKITADAKGTYRPLAQADLENTRKIINNLPSKQSINDKIDRSTSGKGGGDERADWTLDDWRKNDPEKLKKMKEEEPEAFNNLVQQRKSK